MLAILVMVNLLSSVLLLFFHDMALATHSLPEGKSSSRR